MNSEQIDFRRIFEDNAIRRAALTPNPSAQDNYQLSFKRNSKKRKWLRFISYSHVFAMPIEMIAYFAFNEKKLLIVLYRLDSKIEMGVKFKDENEFKIACDKLYKALHIDEPVDLNYGHTEDTDPNIPENDLRDAYDRIAQKNNIS